MATSSAAMSPARSPKTSRMKSQKNTPPAMLHSRDGMRMVTTLRPKSFTSGAIRYDMRLLICP